ncbi:FAD-dependent oxidoreductase [Okibacterium fritillariae]|uniref:FAD-dependent oxidoreductase n=1 Tax=Okibacterium fritillariae TaxID=123320 RepID=UPI0009A84AA0|nr:FAD-dependent oxidoreductase [Okibacterium fritillariae]
MLTEKSRKTFDLVIVGSGTGLAAALAAHERGLEVLVIEKTDLIGGSTARSGGAFWIPANEILEARGAGDTVERADRYLETLVGETSTPAKLRKYVRSGNDTVRMLHRMTRMKFTWAQGYSDYHPEVSGGSAAGRSCECRPFDAARLGPHRADLRPSVMSAPVPMAVTGGDYKWLNLMVKIPVRGLAVAAWRAIQGVGGLLIGRRYVAGGQALAAGLYDGVLRANIPVWRNTELLEVHRNEDGVSGILVRRDGQEQEIDARAGVVLAAGGFDHDLVWRQRHQSKHLEDWSLGSSGNTGDAIKAGIAVGGSTALLDQSWWFPAFAPLAGRAPTVMFPSWLVHDRSARAPVHQRSGGLHVVRPTHPAPGTHRRSSRHDVDGLRPGIPQQLPPRRERFPHMPLPKAWYEQGIAVNATSWKALARKMGVDETSFSDEAARFAEAATAGVDEQFMRGQSAYDRYYGDPTISPNPNLRALDPRRLYAVKIVLSDLGTCGGLRTDERSRVLDAEGNAIDGLYAIGNTAANLFGTRYPGAGGTIGPGLVGGYVAADDAAERARRIERG